MRINTNISAMNSHRQLGANTAAGQKSMERLSSGLRINRAGDDAAGLAISEKMRGQIRGLNQASRNAQDAISLVQTAEGALNETHAILQRMRELAVQSATDTNTSEDRAALQAEINELAGEITRIADNTEFNTQGLLDGTFSGTFHIGANKGQSIEVAIGAMDADTLGVAGTGGLIEEETVTSTGNAIVSLAVEDGVSYTVEKLEEATTIGTGTAFANATHVVKDEVGNIVGASADGKAFQFVATGKEGTQSAVDFDSAVTVTFQAPVKDSILVEDASTDTNFTADTVLASETELASGTYKVVAAANRADSTVDVLVNTATNEIAAYIGADATEWNDASGNLLLKTEAALTVGEEYVVSGEGGIDISTQESADAAIKTINDALEAVSTQRSNLGAVQNRLEHTIANLGTSAENLQAAESRIRDLDMAQEMMDFTKNNILQQAATSMLAQANMAPQSVLQLLG